MVKYYLISNFESIEPEINFEYKKIIHRENRLAYFRLLIIIKDHIYSGKTIKTISLKEISIA